MVDEENLRQWVEDKLDEGIEPKRIKKTLENMGYDPSIVDNIDDPFMADDERPEPEPIEPSENDDSSEDSTDQQIQEREQRRESYRQKGREDKEEQAEGSRFSLPDISMPNINLSGHNVNVPWKASGIVLAVLIVGVGVIYGMTGVASNPDQGQNVSPSQETVSSGTCPDVGVRVSSISVNEGTTSTDVRVSRGDAEVVLELYDSGSIVDTKTLSFGGERTVDFNSEGDKVTMYPVGCPQFDDSMSIN